MPRTRSHFTLWISMIFALTLGTFWGWLMASAPVPRQVAPNYRPRLGQNGRLLVSEVSVLRRRLFLTE